MPISDADLRAFWEDKRDNYPLSDASLTSMEKILYGMWESTANLSGGTTVTPDPVTSATGTTVTDTLTQVSGQPWTVIAATNPAEVAILLNPDFCSYVEEGNKRYYSIRFYFDNDSLFEFSVNGAQDVALVSSNAGHPQGSGDFGARSTFVRRTGVNTVGVDRDNDNNVDMFIDVTFMAIF